MIRIFTDGACRLNHFGGWAFIAYDGDKVIHSDAGAEEPTTNNRMELLAIIKALAYARANHFDNVSLNTDSRYAIHTLTMPLKSLKRRTNQDLMNIGRSLYFSFAPGTINIGWVKGHSGNTGNDAADYLATQARNNLERAMGVEKPLPKRGKRVS